MKELVSSAFREHAELSASIAASGELIAQVEAAARKALAAIRGDGKLMFAGNGGSAAEAQHLATEYASRFKFDRPALPAIALTTDTSVLTSIGNDYGFESVFARQLEAIGRKGDVVFLSSTSGRSPNILAALAAARRLDISTVLLTGKGYSLAADEPDILIVVPSTATARIQEAHLLIGHTICEIVEREMFAP
jgi:D-sedoheptulose 7-phosphate isomerase